MQDYSNQIYQSQQQNGSHGDWTLEKAFQFLHSQFRSFDQDRTEWEIERAELIARVVSLEEELSAAKRFQSFYERRIYMLEKALREQFEKNDPTKKFDESHNKNIHQNKPVFPPVHRPQQTNRETARQHIQSCLEEISNFLYNLPIPASFSPDEPVPSEPQEKRFSLKAEQQINTSNQKIELRKVQRKEKPEPLDFAELTLRESSNAQSVANSQGLFSPASSNEIPLLRSSDLDITLRKCHVLSYFKIPEKSPTSGYEIQLCPNKVDCRLYSWSRDLGIFIAEGRPESSILDAKQILDLDFVTSEYLIGSSFNNFSIVKCLFIGFLPHRVLVLLVENGHIFYLMESEMKRNSQAIELETDSMLRVTLDDVETPLQCCSWVYNKTQYIGVVYSNNVIVILSYVDGKFVTIKRHYVDLDGLVKGNSSEPPIINSEGNNSDLCLMQYYEIGDYLTVTLHGTILCTFSVAQDHQLISEIPLSTLTDIAGERMIGALYLDDEHTELLVCFSNQVLISTQNGKAFVWCDLIHSSSQLHFTSCALVDNSIVLLTEENIVLFSPIAQVRSYFLYAPLNGSTAVEGSYPSARVFDIENKPNILRISQNKSIDWIRINTDLADASKK